MKRTALVLCLLTSMLLPLSVNAQAPPPGGKSPSKISAQLRNVPFKSAVETLFRSTSYEYEVEPGVTNAPISLMLDSVDFDAALRMLIKAAGAIQPEVYVQKNNGRYLIGVQGKGSRVPEVQLTKIEVQFQGVTDLVKQLERLGATDALTTIEPLPMDNTLLVRGTAEEIAKLKDLVRLLDVQTRMLSIRIGVTAPGIGGQAFQLGSMIRTLNGKEVVIDEQTTSGAEMARMRVQVRPIIQGDGEVLTESDWDLSIPVGGGPKGPIRLVKRLATTTRLHPGRSITAGEVDLAPFGGHGTVRLWLRADLIRSSMLVPTTTDVGEPLMVQVFAGKPFLSGFWLAEDLHGQLRRRGDGQYEIRQGSPKEPGQLPKGEMPAQSGPFRLYQGTRVISEQLQFAISSPEDSRLEPDAGGEPFLPLDDLARALGGRVQYDSATDSYRIAGGRRLSTLRFPGSDAKAQ